MEARPVMPNRVDVGLVDSGKALVLLQDSREPSGGKQALRGQAGFFQFRAQFTAVAV